VNSSAQRNPAVCNTAKHGRPDCGRWGVTLRAFVPPPIHLPWQITSFRCCNICQDQGVEYLFSLTLAGVQNFHERLESQFATSPQADETEALQSIS